MREIRVSPDGEQVAIRTDHPADDPRAWGVFKAVKGGAWVNAEVVQDWKRVPTG